ncbi:MAG: M23 family metallopeptidase [Clostridia bacterium]|nr:M23 family metallopeptidase [Clostridia bacterium]
MNNRELEYELTEQEQLNKVKYTKGFYAVFALCVCAIGIAGWYTYADVKNYMHHNESPEISITASEPVNEQAEVKLSGIEKNTTENEDVSDNAEEEVPQETPTVISEPVRSQRVCPTGENKKILSEYSMNNMVYFETLKDWRLHKGTDYAAAQGEEVFSISDGIVSAVIKNELYGEGVELEYKNGFKVTYYGIKPDSNISLGTRIKAGDVVGTVTEVPCEKSLQSHIHLEMTKDNQYVNPETYLNNTDNP